ncbi:MAG: TonB-dependent receptor plug domain-containing protein, partial [Gemmatimonadota bacterium]|nr:TonB-dependent receptor plug domain-containing protein [Gemmatimonadota bacterium]
MGRLRHVRCFAVLPTLVLLPIVALALAPLDARAQGGTITGQVTGGETGAPVELAQVFVEGTRISVTTTVQGRYLLTGVSPGVRTVTVQRLGYSDASQEVTIAEGATVTLDFTLNTAPVALSGIVVTTTGEQQKLSIANVIATIGADSIVTSAPITNVTDLLQGRVPGVMTFSNAGMTGSSARIRIRGFNSLSQDNSPLVIVDGVRVENTTGGGSQIGPGQFSSGWTAGAVTDLNPEEVESIDIVKGPSAATLYGTDGANGVILIRTKRGRPGEARWSVYTEGGVIQQASDVHEGYFAWGRNADGATIRCENRVRVAGGCMLDSLTTWSAFRDSPSAPLGTGHREQLGVQVSGGVERFRYFLATELENETGYLKLSDSEIARKQAERGGVEIPGWQKRPNYLRRLTMRGNITARLNETADINVSTGVTLQQSQIPNNGVFWRGTWGPGYNDDNEGWWLGDRPGDLFATRAGSNITRFTTGINGHWLPRPWLTFRGTVGLDHSAQFSDNLLRRGEDTSGALNTGFRNHIRSDIALYTIDLGSTAEFDINPSVKSRTSFGVQYNRRHQGVAQAYGSDLPPGAQTVNGAANYRASESNVQSVVAGTYVEQNFDLGGRYFLTAAMRADGASNFGKDFQTAWYPKGGFSWLISEEDFFPQG